MPFDYAQQAMGGHWVLRTLNAHHLRFTKSHSAINQSRGGRAEHHPTRRSHPFHPLRHPHLLTNGGVTERPRTDFPGNHLTGVQAHAQPEVHTVTIVDLGRKPLGLLLTRTGIGAMNAANR